MGYAGWVIVGLLVAVGGGPLYIAAPVDICERAIRRGDISPSYDVPVHR